MSRIPLANYKQPIKYLLGYSRQECLEVYRFDKIQGTKIPDI